MLDLGFGSCKIHTYKPLKSILESIIADVPLGTIELKTTLMRVPR